MILSKYEEIMDHIEVTEEMRDRVLGNIERQMQGTTRRRVRPSTMWIPVVAAAAVLLVVCGVTLGVDRGNRAASEQTSGVAFATDESTEETEAVVADESTTVTTDSTAESSDAAADSDVAVQSDSSGAVAALWQAEEYDSAAALSEAVGFTITDITNLPFTPTETSYIAIMGDMAEILYDDADGNQVCYRKSPGTEDNSGDYNDYSVIVDAAIGDYPLTLHGNDETFYLATWTDGTYSYSIGVTNGCTEEELLAMVS